MHVMSIPFQEALRTNGRDEPVRSPMEKNFWRLLWCITEFDCHGMSLAGANALSGFVKSKALFIARRDEMIQPFTGEGNLVGLTGCKQRADLCPARCVQLQLNPLRSVPQHQTQEFTQLNVVHRRMSSTR